MVEEMSHLKRIKYHLLIIKRTILVIISRGVDFGAGDGDSMTLFSASSAMLNFCVGGEQSRRQVVLFSQVQ